jgi:hypothetical protein
MIDETKDEKLDSRVTYSIRLVAGISACVLIFYAAWFSFNNGLELSKDAGIWGQFGDFVGGVLNPLIAFSAFFWLATSVRLQKAELNATRKTLADTLETQEVQAKTVLLSTKLQHLSIQIDALNSQIQSERVYVNQLIQQAQIHGTKYTVINKFGNDEKLDTLLPSLNLTIDALSDQRDDLVALAKKIAPDLLA